MKHAMVLVATLLVACGPKTEQIRLAPKVPSAGSSGAGAVVALVPFEDARGANWQGPKVGEWIPGGGEKYKVTHVIGEPVADLLRDLVGGVLEKSGYAVLRVNDGSAARQPVLKGRLEQLETRFGSGAMIGQIECNIRLVLEAGRSGATPVQRVFKVRHLRHAGNLEPAAFQLVTEEALAKLLVDVALFFDSDEFGRAVRGG